MGGDGHHLLLQKLASKHTHSDHVMDLADVVMTRWVQGIMHPAGPLPIVAVEGEVTRFAASMLDAFTDDIRSGGYDGPLDVGRDLLTVSIGRA